MPYSMSLTENDTIIVIKIFGIADVQKSFDYAKEIHDYAFKVGIKKLLIDCTESENTDTVTNIYRFAYEYMGKLSDFCFQIRIALWVSPDDHSHDFMETVFINTGYRIKLFRNREKAMEYLKGG
jgi:hypothetical protein